jgi:hypothetical protein
MNTGPDIGAQTIHRNDERGCRQRERAFVSESGAVDVDTRVDDDVTEITTSSAHSHRRHSAVVAIVQKIHDDDNESFDLHKSLVDDDNAVLVIVSFCIAIVSYFSRTAS